MLAIIRSDFERIHADIRKLNPEAMIPLPDHPKEVVPYRELLVREEKGKKIFEKLVGDDIVQLNVDAYFERCRP